MEFIHTDTLKIAYEVTGKPNGTPVLLLHGWPDSPSSWKAVASRLHDQGYRTIVPYLRGSYPTEFQSKDIPRYAGAVAMAQDAIDLADQLGIAKFHVVGHDWGARIAYTLAALYPERISVIAALALAYQPRGRFKVPDFQQAMHFWYQFFQCTPGGADAVRKDPIRFARIQWDSWSPTSWFSELDFMEASEHFAHPDWSEVTLNAYRSRYLPDEVSDARYANAQAALENIELIDVPTLMIQGAADRCDMPASSEHQEMHFSRGYRRLLLEGVGHFPHREASETVAEAIAAFFAEQAPLQG